VVPVEPPPGVVSVGVTGSSVGVVGELFSCEVTRGTTTSGVVVVVVPPVAANVVAVGDAAASVVALDVFRADRPVDCRPVRGESRRRATQGSRRPWWWWFPGTCNR